jgi:hypothetical protein
VYEKDLIRQDVALHFSDRLNDRLQLLGVSRKVDTLGQFAVAAKKVAGLTCNASVVGYSVLLFHTIAVFMSAKISF